MQDLIKGFVVAKIFELLKDNGIKNRMVAPGGNMGLQRSMMPQIASNRLSEYHQWMGKKGVKFQKKTVKASKLRLIQSEYNKDKVLSLMRLYKEGKNLPEPPLVSSDHFVVDGSHRFLAIYNLDPTNADIEILQANVPAKQLLEMTKSFPGAQYRTWSDNKVPQKQ